jgi:hypothetical protein
MELCFQYIHGDNGMLVDQRFLPRITEGEVRAPGCSRVDRSGRSGFALVAPVSLLEPAPPRQLPAKHRPAGPPRAAAVGPGASRPQGSVAHAPCCCAAAAAAPNPPPPPSPTPCRYA